MDEATGLLIDYDYAELLALEPEGSPESASDADAMKSGTETSDEEKDFNTKTHRTVSLFYFIY